MTVLKLAGPLVLLGATLGCSQPQSQPEPVKADPGFAVQQAKMETQSTVPPGPAPRIDEKRAMRYLREIVAFGRRAPGSPGHKKLQDYIRAQFKNDNLEADAFKAKTPAGEFELTNFVVRFPGTDPSVIVLASHYDTNYPLKDYVGANDGGSSTALLIELANHLRARKLQGPSVWLVFFDGEEAFEKWTESDSLYGSRHLAARWQRDGTLKKIKAFILADMIGDSDLNIDKDANSTPWLQDLVYKAATNLGHRAYFFGRETMVDDDHIPFARAGVPVVDIIDLDYGYGNVFHHSPEDTLERVSPKSLKIVGDTILETLRLLGSH